MNNINNISNYCYICSEFIGNANINITICNHYFHSSCLFDYVAINGFFCPNCLSSLNDKKISEEIESVIRIIEHNVEQNIELNDMMEQYNSNFISRIIEYAKDEENDLANRDEVIRILVGYFSCSSVRERN